MDYVSTILTSPDADNLFSTRNRLCGNAVLEATLRYIAIKNHDGDIEKVKLITSEARSASYGENNGDVYTEERFDDIELLIITPRNRGDNLLSITKNGWVSLDSPPYPVAALLSAKSSETRIYVNNDKKRAIVFVRTTTDTWCEIFASCLFRVLPWRFNNDEDSIALAKAISKNQPSEFKRIIDDYCKNIDFSGIMTRRALIGWGNGQREAQLKTMEEQLQACLNNINAEQSRLTQYLDDYAMINERYNALSRTSADNDDLFYKFFLNHKQLSIHRVYNVGTNGKSLEYCILDTIEYFDEDEFINIYNNPNSEIGRCNSNMRRILYGLFKEHKGVIRAEAVFRLNNLSSLTILRGVRTGKYYDTHLAHPHLVRYGCLGGNEQYINNYMRLGDWDMAIEQSIVAVKNLNMSDSTVVSAMINDLGSSETAHCSCIIADNGQAMTPPEFLQYLQEADKKEVENNG